MERIAFRTHGLACAIDALALERQLGRLGGIDRVYVNPVNDAAYVVYDPDQLTADVIKTTIERQGLRVHQLPNATIDGF